MGALRFSLAALAALACVALLGCNEVAGIKDPVSGEAEGGAGGLTGIDRFPGTWSSVDGLLELTNCASATSLAGQQGRLVIAKSSPTEVVFLIDACQLEANVAGDTLSIVPGQMCTLQGSAAKGTPTATFTYGASQFTLVAGTPTQANETLTASVSFTNVTTGAFIDRCDYRETASFTKL
jgi:hypothetical protein